MKSNNILTMVLDMKVIHALLFFVVILTATSTLATGIGSVNTIEGQGWVIRGEKEFQATTGTRLFVEDKMKTGKNGAMGIILHDDTIISMGPQSELVLAEFVFQPEKNHFAMLTKFIKGTFSYLSGVMAKLSPEAVRVETPVGMVAIRGTHFLVKIEE